MSAENSERQKPLISYAQGGSASKLWSAQFKYRDLSARFIERQLCKEGLEYKNGGDNMPHSDIRKHFRTENQKKSTTE